MMRDFVEDLIGSAAKWFAAGVFVTYVYMAAGIVA